jgi:hypothetical protein
MPFLFNQSSRFTSIQAHLSQPLSGRILNKYGGWHPVVYNIPVFPGNLAHPGHIHGDRISETIGHPDVSGWVDSHSARGDLLLQYLS